MQHDADGVPQGVHIVAADVAPADPDRALGGVVQARNELDERRFGRARAADDAHRRTCRDVERDVGEGIFLRLGVVFEADVVKVDLAVGDGVHRCGGVCKVGRLGQDLTDAAGAGQRAGHLQKDAGEHHDRVEHLQNIAQKRRQLADGHRADEDIIAAEPKDADDGRIHDSLERRQVEDGIAEGFRRSIAQFRVDGVELGVLVVAADERLDGTDGGQGLLDAAIQVIHGALLAAIERADLCDDPGEDGGQDRRCDEEYNRQPRAEHAGHRQPHAEHDRAAHQRTQTGVDGVEHDRDVGGHAGDEGRIGEAVKVGEVEFLHGGILRHAQLCREPVCEPRRVPRIQQPRDKRKHRAQNHQPALPEDDGHIMGGHAVIHEGGHQDGDDHFKDTFNKDQPHRREQIAPVRAGITEDFAQILHGWLLAVGVGWLLRKGGGECCRGRRPRRPAE